ncbi:hypothetical protein ACFL0S_05895 [Thermodesulfobacteriota bacterium]
MKTAKQIRFLIVVYFGVMASFLLLMIVTPLIIQFGVAITDEYIIEEDIIETTLIIILLGISYIIFGGFKRSLRAYEEKVETSGEENSRLVSRLADVTNYIGTVNVELQEIQATLCGVERYPQTNRELRRYIDHLVAKTMMVAGTTWAVVRIISRHNCRTIKEYDAVRPHRVLPSSTMGNREILENLHIEGLRIVCSRQKNLDVRTVCILPKTDFSEEETILITAIISQIELLFLLYRAGFIHQQFLIDHNEQK